MNLPELALVVGMTASGVWLFQEFAAACRHRRKFGHFPGEHIGHPDLKKKCGFP